MHDTEGFPDDVPVADAVEQNQSTADASSGDDAPVRLDESDVPLETTFSDWQDQREAVPIDEAEFDGR